MTTEPPPANGTRPVTTGILLATMAGLAFASTGFIANHLVDGGTPGVIVGFYEAVFGLVLVLAVNARGLHGRPRITRSAVLWITLAAAGFAVAFGSFYTGLSHIDYSVGAPILGTVPLVSYVVVLFVLRGEERITPRALLGAALVVAGVALIGATG